MSPPSATSAPSSPDYFGKLAPDSVRSLELQGGLMSADEVEAFRANPLHEEAVRLRRYRRAGQGPARRDAGLRLLPAPRRGVPGTMIGRQEVEAAWRLIRPHVRRTPVIELAGRRAGRRRSARAQARIVAAQRLLQGPRRVSQAAREPGSRSRHRRRIGRQPRCGRGLCRARARAQGRDLRPDRRLADQGRAPQELRRGRPSGRRGLCRGAGAVGEARGGDRCADRAGL